MLLGKMRCPRPDNRFQKNYKSLKNRVFGYNFLKELATKVNCSIVNHRKIADLFIQISAISRTKISDSI
jgi:hypothetical protein